MKRGSRSFFAALAVACAAPPSSLNHEVLQPEVVVYSTEARSELAGDDREVVLQHLRRLPSRCSVDSVRYPSIFSLEDAAAWSRATAAPRLWARLARIEDFTWFQGQAAFGELLLELPPGNHPGNLLGRGPAGVVQFTKCDGSAVLELVCLPELAPFLPAPYRHSCDLVGTS